MAKSNSVKPVTSDIPSSAVFTDGPWFAGETRYIHDRVAIRTWHSKWPFARQHKANVRHEYRSARVVVGKTIEGTPVTGLRYIYQSTQEVRTNVTD